MATTHDLPKGGLSARELKMIPILVKGFCLRVGSDKAISGRDIIKALWHNHGLTVRPGEVRSMIHYIRCNHLVKNLVASKKGYYIENDPEKIKKYLHSLLHRREAITHVIHSFQQTSLHEITYTFDRRYLSSAGVIFVQCGEKQPQKTLSADNEKP